MGFAAPLWTSSLRAGHVEVPSEGLRPHHPRAPLFTNAGMNQFLPYFLGEEVPPYKRAVSVQKCVRVRGKHDDIEQVGRSPKHVTFFEMLGNFSFGDYFKAEVIPWAWELLTEVLGFDGDRLWVTVYTDRRRGGGHLGRQGRVPQVAHPAHRRRQFLGNGRHRPVRPVL